MDNLIKFKQAVTNLALALEDNIITDPNDQRIISLIYLSNVAGFMYLNAIQNGLSFNDLAEVSRKIFTDDYLLQAPWMERSFRKPLGYPGDYLTMVGLYDDNRFVGKSPIAQTINQVFTSTPAAQAVRNRKDIMVESLHRKLDERGWVRILSVASGPAQELFEALSTHDLSKNIGVEVILLDQDRGALDYALNRLDPIEYVHVEALEESIIPYINGERSFSPWGEFDAILAAGIFDYLGDSKWVALSGLLVKQLAPGGELFIGNMVPQNVSRWFMEIHLDWHLKYRTHEKMLELIQRAAPRKQANILEETTGVNPFVVVKG